MSKVSPTHMFPIGLCLHPNEDDEERTHRTRISAVDTDRCLTDRLRYPYLDPFRHQLPERDRLPFRRDRV